MSLVVSCPSCERKLRVPEDLLGQEVKCPSCGEVFTASADLGAAPPPRPPEREPSPTESPPDDDQGRVTDRRGEAAPPDDDEAPEPPRRSRVRPGYGRRQEDEEDEDDYDRGRRRYDGYRGSREAARARVSGPATALTVTGGIALALSILGFCLGVVQSMGDGRLRPGGDPEEGVVRIVWSIVIICCSGFVLAGARKMKNLESYGMAMAAAIVAMLPCSGCCLLGLPFGIWALIVLADADVKAAFH